MPKNWKMLTMAVDWETSHQGRTHILTPPLRFLTPCRFTIPIFQTCAPWALIFLIFTIFLVFLRISWFHKLNWFQWTKSLRKHINKLYWAYETENEPLNTNVNNLTIILSWERCQIRIYNWNLNSLIEINLNTQKSPNTMFLSLKLQ